MVSIARSGDSNPAVDADAVYGTYVCQQDLPFARATGALLWEHPGIYSGSGGTTAVVADGKLFARDASTNGGLILSAATGAELRSFVAHAAPAADGKAAFVLSDSTRRPSRTRDSVRPRGSWEATGTSPARRSSSAISSSLLRRRGSCTRRTARPVRRAGRRTSAPRSPAPTRGASPRRRRDSGRRADARRAGGVDARGLPTIPATGLAPTLDGTAQADQLLTADVGIWSGL